MSHFIKNQNLWALLVAVYVGISVLSVQAADEFKCPSTTAANKTMRQDLAKQMRQKRSELLKAKIHFRLSKSAKNKKTETDVVAARNDYFSKSDAMTKLYKTNLDLLSCNLRAPASSNNK